MRQNAWLADDVGVIVSLEQSVVLDVLAMLKWLLVIDHGTSVAVASSLATLSTC